MREGVGGGLGRMQACDQEPSADEAVDDGGDAARRGLGELRLQLALQHRDADRELRCLDGGADGPGPPDRRLLRRAKGRGPGRCPAGDDEPAVPDDGQVRRGDGQVRAQVRIAVERVG
jgi:hypothetical protein